MKKFLCFIISALLISSSVSVNAVSLDATGVAVAEAGRYGIMNGDPDGNLRLDDTVTRAEMAKIISVTMNCMDVSQCETVFSDVANEHWASGYVMYAYGAGIIDGIGDGLFNPDGNVTCEEAIKMIVCALGYGYELLADQYGAYPDGYIHVANDLELITDGVRQGTEFATRAEIAVLIVNALDVPHCEEIGLAQIPEYYILDGQDGKPFKSFRSELEK